METIPSTWEDAASAKFRTQLSGLIQSFMVMATSEIISIFDKVFTEAKKELKHSRREVVSLQKQLAESEQKFARMVSCVQKQVKIEDENLSSDELIVVPSNPIKAELADHVSEHLMLDDAELNPSIMTLQGSSQSGFSEPVKQSDIADFSSRANSNIKQKNFVAGKNKTRRVGCAKHEACLALEVPGSNNNPFKQLGVESSTAKVLLAENLNNVKQCGPGEDQPTAQCCQMSSFPSGKPLSHKESHQTVAQARRRGHMSNRLLKDYITWEELKILRQACKKACNLCGQFYSSKGMVLHSRVASRKRRKCLCNREFVTDCSWNIHKKFHSRINETQRDRVTSSKSHAVSPDLGARVQVCLERISLDSLGPSFSTNVTQFPAKDKAKEHFYLTKSDSATRPMIPQLPDEQFSGVAEMAKEGSSIKTRPSSEQEGNHINIPNGGSDLSTTMEKSSAKKRRISECTHDVYGSVYPVEKILRRRLHEGRNEMRVKWQPCSLCGAKWKNTWEPAESLSLHQGETV
ncbi:uncharacterized protein LOC114789062 isoform X2 [Denticeps clupeoides]|nr:uncharacterized protein LOC114789062 isoform X2 [Denticeps clupeoides]